HDQRRVGGGGSGIRRRTRGRDHDDAGAAERASGGTDREALDGRGGRAVLTVLGRALTVLGRSCAADWVLGRGYAADWQRSATNPAHRAGREPHPRAKRAAEYAIGGTPEPWHRVCAVVYDPSKGGSMQLVHLSRGVAVFVLTSLAISGCASLSNKEKSEVIGAIEGGVAGVVIGRVDSAL